MNKYEFRDDNGNTYKRVSKATARKLFNNNVEIYLCAVNLRPFSMWHCECRILRTDHDLDDIENTFEHHVNAFEFYNCRDTETGKYTAFYVKS